MTKPPPRSLFSAGTAKVQLLHHRLDDPSRLPPRDAAWLGGASVPTGLPPSAETDEARLEGELLRLQQQQQQLDSVLRRYLGGVQKLAELVRDFPATQVEDTVEMACVLAQAIVGREVELDREHAGRLVTEMLKQLDAPRDVMVRMNPTDLERLGETHPELAASTQLTFVPDETLSLGGCVLETPKRILDASVESRLQAVRGPLVDMLRKKEDEP